MLIAKICPNAKTIVYGLRLILALPCFSNMMLFKAVPLCSYIHSPFCLILQQPNLPQCLSCCLPCFGLSYSPEGLGVVFRIVFSALHCAHQPGRWVGGQAKRAVVNEVWERGEIVMCIAVPDTCILAESNYHKLTY